MFEAFLKAIPEPRGCGVREEGGAYAFSRVRFTCFCTK